MKSYKGIIMVTFFWQLEKYLLRLGIAVSYLRNYNDKDSGQWSRVIWQENSYHALITP